MTTIIQAFAPANISFVFKIHEDPDPQKAGSMGIGATLNEGATLTVREADKTTVSYNGELITFPAVLSVLHALSDKPLSVTIASPFPLGSGFGMSGASALATAYAVNKLLHLDKTKKELALIAHKADVANKSGLGDVVNQYFGGCLLKLRPSSEFVVEKLPLTNCKVYCHAISKLPTESVMTNTAIKHRINEAAAKALQEVRKKENNITLEELLTIAKMFARTSTLLTDESVNQTISEIEETGGHASMIMLGNGIISNQPFQDATAYTISDTPAHLL